MSGVGRRVHAMLVVAVLGALAIALPANTASGSTGTGHGKPKPTIVLVHGAWADASSWAPVTARLQRKGYTVLAAPNPLRGLSSDSAYLAAFLQQHTSGPVVLVGHSYGGAVVTNAATADADVKALVYVDAFVPDVGDSVLSLQGGGGDPTALFDFVAYPGAPAGDADLYIKTALFPQLFAGDLPAGTAAQLAASQRPVTLSALSQPSAGAAWKTLPSWYLVGTKDAILPPALQLSMAERAHSHITKVPASHLAMLSKPDAVTDLILTAARATD
ncbi:alpha/beta fold hydrolase [Rugosimonospora africana]|uniref:Alpha/beta hydrolase n=1 Tax=Rugosimonospora africana TaxID=556532 RepID=A0A8J3QTZ9_9ACTN|nr:alpha/beta hydrolase [Rugosimonospora africana]GIH16037.1 alpha/beta hydrolase [Rugosimonospora africana]